MKVTHCNLCWNSNIDCKLLGDHIQRRGGELGKCAGVARVISNRNAYQPCSPLLSISQHVEVPESLSLFLHCFKEEIRNLPYGQHPISLLFIICGALSDLL